MSRIRLIIDHLRSKQESLFVLCTNCPSQRTVKCAAQADNLQLSVRKCLKLLMAPTLIGFNTADLDAKNMPVNTCRKVMLLTPQSNPNRFGQVLAC